MRSQARVFQQVLKDPVQRVAGASNRIADRRRPEDRCHARVSAISRAMTDGGNTFRRAFNGRSAQDANASGLPLPGPQAGETKTAGLSFFSTYRPAVGKFRQHL